MLEGRASPESPFFLGTRPSGGEAVEGGTTPPIPPHALLLRGDPRHPRRSFLLSPLISAFPSRGAASRAGG